MTLNIGDVMLFSSSRESGDHAYEGVVHRILPSEVQFLFGDGFNLYTLGDLFKVQLVLNRMPLRRAHLAVTMDHPLGRILFPNPSPSLDQESEPIQDDDIPASMDPRVRINTEQMRLVMNVLNRQPGSPPLILFGP